MCIRIRADKRADFIRIPPRLLPRLDFVTEDFDRSRTSLIFSFPCVKRKEKNNSFLNSNSFQSFLPPSSSPRMRTRYSIFSRESQPDSITDYRGIVAARSRRNQRDSRIVARTCYLSPLGSISSITCAITELVTLTLSFFLS